MKRIKNKIKKKRKIAETTPGRKKKNHRSIFFHLKRDKQNSQTTTNQPTNAIE
jgi:hypothetical protein